MISTSRGLIALCAGAMLLFYRRLRLSQARHGQPAEKQGASSPSPFFEDGRSERPLVENTVARGSLADDELFVPKDSNNFPLPLNPALLERGEERYRIFCTPCHGLQGDGNGMVAMRGMKRPPSYHQDRLRQAPNGYIYDVMTSGFGQMLGYSAQIPPARPLGHHRLHPRPAAQPQRESRRLARRASREAESRRLVCHQARTKRQPRTRQEAASNGCAGISSSGKRQPPATTGAVRRRPSRCCCPFPAPCALPIFSINPT